MRIGIIAFFAFLLLSIVSCKNDIEVNAPYKDIAVIYGFLDQNQPIQYIRIQKMYQNSTDLSTNEGAQIADSLYFDTLVVNLVNLTNGATYPCWRVDTIPKDSGFFSSARNTLYAVSIPKNNGANEQYELKVLYPKSNATFGGKTNLVKDAVIEERRVVIRTNLAGHFFRMNYFPGLNSALYDVDLRFYYKEALKSDTSIYSIKYVDYNLSKSKLVKYGVQETEFVYSAPYYEFLSEAFKPDANVVRSALSFELRTIGGTAEFENLLSLSTPNLSIVSKNPTYTNITNGIGIFTSRNYTSKTMINDDATIELLNTTLPGFSK